ncbi:SpaH/EbpB family LPXTG-anchored major pilin [Bifidobacterium sp. ESL0764]|uniref:SpaH/EbpB family LPXTG-anchored major pilin n=1 Tax=Bifidobacterium sp. ESL0764 TaxID=2983228 RepID=UPI0023F8F009|nr:SpaH/EbpB family LPXTG-anchored major pilin [Bifidobacterium sp. ESL0764]WEV65413.1 SpaH/EbpB family LPXTG-anchored major pilin [Bifidobacterium sp. ESL0764]
MKSGKLMKLLAMVTACVASMATMAAGAVSASADDSRDNSHVNLTIKGSEYTIAGHKFTATKLADYVNVDAVGGTFGVSTIQDNPALVKAINEAGDVPAGSKSDPMAWLVQQWNGEQELTSPYTGSIRTFVTKLSKESEALDATALQPVEGAKGDTSVTMDLVNGIYLIRDITDVVANNRLSRAVPMLVSTTVNKIPNKGSSEIDVKALNVKVTKHADKNTHKIGDTVPFTIESHVPLFTATNVYSAGLEIDDQLDDGFTYDNSSTPVVKIGDTTLIKDTDYTLKVYTRYGHSPVAADAKVAGAEMYFLLTPYVQAQIQQGNYDIAGKSITITYDVVLNENAKVDADGNVNDVQLDYKPGCNWTTVPGNKVYVFTGSIKLIKRSQGTGEMLPGAKFQVFEDPDATTPLNFVYEGQADDGKTYDVYRTAKAGESGSSDVLTTSAHPFWLKGFEDGTYTFKETKAPDGYLLPMGLSFKVKVSHTVDDAAPSKATYKYELTPDANKLTSIADNMNELTVVNTNSVLKLPATGAVGIIMRLVAGALVIGAALAIYFGVRHLQRVRKAAKTASR